MFSSIRKNKKAQNVVMILTIAALASYVLVSFGSAPPKAQQDTIVEFGSSKIKMRDAFIQSENLKGRFGNISEELFNQLTANQLVRNALLRDGADKLGLSVSDQELRDYVIRARTTPDGGFINEETWSNIIRRNYRVQVDSFENYLRDNDLKSGKFSGLFLDGAHISEADVLARFEENNRQVKMEMLTLHTFNVASEVKMDKDEDVKKFWEKNKDQFMSGQQRQVKYLAVPYQKYEDEITVTDEEAQAEYDKKKDTTYTLAEHVQVREIVIKVDSRSNDEAYQLATKVSDEITDGMDFNVAMQKYTEGRNRGITRVNKNTRDAELDAALFNMEDNDISPPIKGQDGNYYIFQRLSYGPASVREFDTVKNGIVRNLKRNRAREQAQKALEEFNNKFATGGDFEAAAKEMELEVKTSPFFDNNRFSTMGTELNLDARVRSSIFNLAKVGDVTEIFQTGVNHVICMWSAENDGAPLEWDTHKDRIKADAAVIAQKELIKETLEAIKAAALKDPEKPLKELKGKRDWLKDDFFTESPEFGQASIPYQIRREGIDFDNDIYSLEAGQFLEGFESSADTRFVLARVTEKLEPDMNKFEEERFTIVENLRAENGNMLLQSYLYEKQKQYDPEQKVRGRLLAQLNRR
ncbi:MAG: peptidyl-prolyl cis-trans isomerase [Acidobacteriota bacterium]|nr:peptidyl-prolyl cis-trans isomerase [Acidobacteriota bacterium]